MPAFPRPRRRAWSAIALGRPIDVLFSDFGEPVAAASIAQVHKARTRGRDAGRSSPSRWCVPACASSSRAISRPCASPPAIFERFVPDARRLTPAGGRGDAGPLRRDRDGSAPRSGGHVGIRRQYAGRPRVPRAASRMGPDRARRADRRVDRRHPAVTTSPPSTRPATIATRSAASSSRLSCATPSATASSTPTCTRAICSSTRRAASSPSISASWAGSASKERRFLAEILLGFIRRDYRRVAEVHFEAGYVPRPPRGRRFRAGHPRHRRADPRPPRRRDLDGAPADAAVRGDGPVRHGDAHRARHAAEDHGGGRRRGAHPRPEARHVDARPSRWCANGSSAISGPSAASRRRPAACRPSRSRRADLPELALRAERVLAKLERSADNGFPLSRESLEAIGRAKERASPAGRPRPCGSWLCRASC